MPTIATRTTDTPVSENPAVPTVSVVTGANSGIGRATAIHLAAQGHTVFGTVRSISKAGKLEAMAADAGVHVELVELDIADYESVRAGFAWILDATGGRSAATRSPRSARRRCIST